MAERARSTKLERLSSIRTDLCGHLLRKDIKRLVLEGLEAGEIAQRLEKPVRQIQKVLRDGQFQKSVLDSYKEINRDEDHTLMERVRNAHLTVTETITTEAPRAMRMLADIAFARTEDERAELGLEKPLSNQQRISVLQWIVERSPEGNPAQKIDVRERKTYAIDSATMELAQKALREKEGQPPPIDITPQEQEALTQ